jgi:tight adherence protein B
MAAVNDTESQVVAMELMPLIMMTMGTFVVLAMVFFALAGPSAQRAQSRRLTAVRSRHGSQANAPEAQLRKISSARTASKTEAAFGRLLPNPALLAKRLAMTGKSWTVGQYGMASAGLFAVVAALLMIRGAPVLLAGFAGVVIGVGLPHKTVSFFIKRRIAKFTAKFPDAIELLVRGLRSGLPITETIAVVGHEVEGPVGVEFRMVTDKMKIGKSMDSALQDTADRLGTPEFQFFVITIAIQRETGGNLAETLANLATVLRQRSQMKLKIKAMSSESKASAYIVGSLPFIVFGMIWMINAEYMQNFFIDQRLMIAGIGGAIWMAIGAFIMAKMVNFEI